jgi:hypothetical protein
VDCDFLKASERKTKSEFVAGTTLQNLGCPNEDSVLIVLINHSSSSRPGSGVEIWVQSISVGGAKLSSLGPNE